MDLRSHLTYANITATLALFVALGGSSYAALTITGRDVKDGSLTTRDVRNHSLLARDFKRGVLPRLKLTIRKDEGAALPYPPVPQPVSLINAVPCEGRERLVGGGVSAPSEDLNVPDYAVEESFPLSGDPGWDSRIRYEPATPDQVYADPTVWAICASF